MNLGDEITVNSRSFDNSLRKSWRCRVIGIKGNALTFIGEFKQKVEHPDLGTIDAGTISTEYFWLDRWYNIFRFSSPDGRLKFWYCNITMPPQLTEDSLDYVDLDIDIVIWPDGTHKILDEAEFESNAQQFGFDAALRENVCRSVEEIIELSRSGEPPFENLNLKLQQI